MRSQVPAARRYTLLAMLVSVCVAVSQSVHADSRFSQTHEWCIQRAAIQYYGESDPLRGRISYVAFVDLIHALMGVEYGCGVQHKNANTSIDYGCMQINSSNLHALASYGIDAVALQYNDCQNIMIGAWMLHDNIVSGSDLWTSIGNYNSHTRKFNVAYQDKVWRQLQRIWANRLAGR